MVQKEATICTDEWPSYNGIGNEYKGGHFVVKHSGGQYVNGIASTNTAESYFSLFKRGVIGAFHHVSRVHLHRYNAEFDFRWNHRKLSDGDRTDACILQCEGKRLMYKKTIVGNDAHGKAKKARWWQASNG